MRCAPILHLAAALSLVGCPGGGSSHTGDGGPGDDGGPDGGGSACSVTGEQTATIYSGGPLFLTATSPDDQYYVGGVNFALTGTSTLTGSPSNQTVQLLDLGPGCGLSAITSIPSAGFANSLDVITGHGYAAKMPDGSFALIYVNAIDASSGVTVTYQYPSPICPIGVTIEYGTPSNSCGLTLDGVLQGNRGRSDTTGCGFLMVACSSSASVETWGAGGGGAVPCLGSPGSGAGGGGGGGYGKGTVTLTPGALYFVHAGTGGAPHGGGVAGCTSTPAFGGDTGGTSSFGEIAGNLLVSATGGNGGTGGSTSARSAGGIGGSSSATTNTTGGTGGDGLLNTSCGASAMGPGGAGGVGANGGSGGTGGCSAPGTPSAPGGGGAGGSQGGAPTIGAEGRVIVSW